MNVLGIIPARGGSSRVTRKNLQHVGGFPLFARAMMAARKSTRLTDWRLSTDDVDIALGCVYIDGNIKRVLSRRRSAGDVPIIDVVREALEDLKDTTWDAVCLIQPTSPFRTEEDIDESIAMLRGNTRSVVSVSAQTGQRNGAVYVTRMDMVREGLLFDADSARYRMPHNRSIDINTMDDLNEAQRIANEEKRR